MFDGEFEPIDSKDPNPFEFHNYAEENVERPQPPTPGAPPTCSDHDYQEQSNPRMASTDNSKSPESDPAGYLDSVFSMSELKTAISALKSNKARGWDNLPNECWKFADNSFLEYVLLLFNLMKGIF